MQVYLLKDFLPNMLSSTIGLNDLGELYNTLLGLGITTIIDLLKMKRPEPWINTSVSNADDIL